MGTAKLNFLLQLHGFTFVGAGPIMPCHPGGVNGEGRFLLANERIAHVCTGVVGASSLEAPRNGQGVT